MKHEYKMLIDGKLVSSGNGETMEVINPANGSVVGHAPKGTPEDVNKAVEAAFKAQPAWGNLPYGDRGNYLMKLAAVIRKNFDELVKLETMQYGGPIFKTSSFDIPFASNVLEYFAGIGRSLTGLTLPAGPNCRVMTIKEPIGVVGLISPWNFPIVTALSKVAPALITGNACVLKPASCAPLTVLRVSEFAIEAGIPPGILNIISGPGSTVGEAMVTHPKIGKINFTGDSITGKRIMNLASAYVKPVASELGGKNAFVVMPDADLTAAVEGAIWATFFNSGQNCASTERFFIHESVYDKFAEKFVEAAKKLKIGDPLKPDTMIGPVAYKSMRDNIEEWIEKAKKSGFKLLVGGERPNTPDTKDGYFVAPTLFGDCDNKSEFMQEEIFGPVAGLARFKTPEEAVALVNDSRYGLCSSIWTKDFRTGMLMAEKIKTGTVWINQHLKIVSETPWGGCKESGWTKENSTLVLDEYTMTKHMWIDLEDGPKTPWEHLFK